MSVFKRKASTELQRTLKKKRKIAPYVQEVFEDIASALESSPGFTCLNTESSGSFHFGLYYITQKDTHSNQLSRDLEALGHSISEADLKRICGYNRLKFANPYSNLDQFFLRVDSENIIPVGTILFIKLDLTTINEWPNFIAADLITPYKLNIQKEHEFVSPIGEVKNLRHGWNAHYFNSPKEEIQRLWFPNLFDFASVWNQIQWIKTARELSQDFKVTVKTEDSPTPYTTERISIHRSGSIGASDLADQGIYWNPTVKQWEVNREINGVRIYGGTWPTEKEAVAKSKELLRQYKNMPLPRVALRSHSNPPSADSSQRSGAICQYHGCQSLSSTGKLHLSRTLGDKGRVCWACKTYEDRHGLLIPRQERRGGRAPQFRSSLSKTRPLMPSLEISPTSGSLAMPEETIVKQSTPSSSDKIEKVCFENGEPKYLVVTPSGWSWRAEENARKLSCFETFERKQRTLVRQYLQDKANAASKTTSQSISTDLLAIAQNPKEFETRMHQMLRYMDEYENARQRHDNVVKKCQQLAQANVQLQRRLSMADYERVKSMELQKAQVKQRLTSRIDSIVDEAFGG